MNLRVEESYQYAAWGACKESRRTNHAVEVSAMAETPAVPWRKPSVEWSSKLRYTDKALNKERDVSTPKMERLDPFYFVQEMRK